MEFLLTDIGVLLAALGGYLGFRVLERQRAQSVSFGLLRRRRT
jgi:hypothetical protein